MAHGEILEFLRELGRWQSRLTDRTSELLPGTGLGDTVSLSHELRVAAQDDGAAEVTLLHRFEVWLTPDYAEWHQVDVVAVLTVLPHRSSVRVAVDAHLEHAVAGLPEGPSVLWERRLDGAEPAEAVRFLGAGVEEFCALENPFGPLAGRDGA